ncbi:MAG: 4-hydroxy-tetrahydrodipicolinate synthase [Eubacteriales bacterium]|nr:4-hydroxy-tetrahydrodipicolinate synthase [Eubacteriales bacterium]
MKRTLFVGSATAMVTPFYNDQVDYKAFANMIDHQLSNGTSALVICGTTGEPATLSNEEKEKLIAFAVEQVDGAVPVIAGTGGNNTADVMQKAKRYARLGVDAQLCVTPYYNKTTQAGLIAHYTAIADEGSLPVILYNVPGRTGLNMLPNTVATLAEHPNIIGHKEACADLAQATEMFRLLQGSLPVYSGMDELTVPMLSLGSLGVISVASNLIPQKMAAMVMYYLNGEHKKSLDLQLHILPFVNAIFKQTSPTPIKAAMEMLQLCKEDVRLPLIPLTAQEKEVLKKAVESVL